MRRNALIAVLLTLATVPLQAQPPQPPQWLQQINPADYALLAADLPAGMSVWGEIDAEANAAEVGVTDAQGRTTEQQFMHFVLMQAVKVEQEEFVQGVSMYVAVFATPAESIAFTRQQFGDYGMNPDWMVNANELGDRRVTANGGSVTGPGRAIIRYRNMVANFSWNGGIDDFATAKTVQVAKLWLNKVAGPPGADLHLEPDTVLLKNWSNHPTVEREPAADKQYVIAQVDNKSPDVVAKNVRAFLLVRLDGEAEHKPAAAPVVVGDIAAGGAKAARFEWDLKGQNVINADLLITVQADGPADIDPRDNELHLPVSIYYAYNGKNAFRWTEDSYQFGNYGYEVAELEELTQGLLATVIGQLYTDPKAVELLNHLLFPQTYMRFYEYLYEGIQGGAGGHCYGMAATAGLYFMDDSLRPGGGSTWNLSPDVAGPNINLYQRAQMVPLVQAMINGNMWMDRNWGGVNCLNTVRQKLRDERIPVILSLSGTRKEQEQVMVNGQPQQQLVEKSWGHAVLAYKLIELPSGEAVIHVYDPNLPPMLQWPSQAPMSAFGIRVADGAFGVSSDMRALYIRGAAHPDGESTLDHIAARQVTREVSLAESNALMPDLRAKLKEMAKFLENAKRVMAVLRCPADVVFTDQQGRRVGEAGGVSINEVPGAQIRTSGDVEIYLLPSGLTWSVAITGTGAGAASFDIIRPDNGEPAITSFQDIPVSAGSSAAGTLNPQGAIAALSVAGTTRGPTFTGTLSGDRVTWQEPSTPTTPTTPATPTPPATPGAASATLVICSGQENGRPIGAADRFVRPAEVCGVLNFANQSKMTVTRIWLRNGQEVNRGDAQIDGTGWAWGSLRSNDPTGLQAGEYEMLWKAGDRVLARRAFTITERAGQTPTAPPVTPTQPATPTAGTTATWSFADASASRQATMPIPTAGGELTLEFRYSKPGSLFDTCGILAAPDGSYCLAFREDGTVTWQIMGRGVQSNIRHATGWHYMVGEAALEPGRWHTASVTWGPGGMELYVDGWLIGSDPAVLTLANVPLYFGDFPPDGKPQGFVGEIRNVNVTAWQGGEG